jgi:hypothetical protein
VIYECVNVVNGIMCCLTMFRSLIIEVGTIYYVGCKNVVSSLN